MKKRELMVAILLLAVMLIVPWSSASATSVDGYYTLLKTDTSWAGTDANRTKATSGDYDYAYGDEGNVTYHLPWPSGFTFYGVTYKQIIVDVNGYIRFAAPSSGNSFNLATTTGTGSAIGMGPVIAPWNNDLSSYYYGGVFIQHKTSPEEQVVIEWQTETYTEEGYYLPNDFEAVIYPNGTIRFDYRSFATQTGKDFGSGISKGNGIHAVNLTAINPMNLTSGNVPFLARNSFTFAVSRRIAAAPTAVSFGTVGSGGTSQPQIVTLTNTGVESLNIGPLALSGTNAASFSIENDSCSRTSVPAGGSCKVNVVVSPSLTDVGPLTAALIVPSDDPATPNLTISLNGTAQQLILSLTKSPLGATKGAGTVTSAPSGISCSGTCAGQSAQFVPGTVVTLTAAPDPGSVFAGWSGTCSGTDTCTVTMDGLKSVKATFWKATSSLPDVYVGNKYPASLSASGGTTSYTWTLISGALPPDLTLKPNGTFIGTLTLADVKPDGTPYAFTVQIKDSKGVTASQNLAISVYNKPTVTSPSSDPSGNPTPLPNGFVGVPYVQTLTATGGKPSYGTDGTSMYTWSYSGALPPGLYLNTSTGVIYSKPNLPPTKTGTYKFSVKATDSNGVSSQPVSCTITIFSTQMTVSALPAGGLYNSAQTVQLASSTTSTTTNPITIYYTIDGTDPTTASTVYNAPLTISATTTLKFFAVDSHGNNSAVRTEVYTIDNVPPTLAISTLADGRYTNNEVLNVTGTASDTNGLKDLKINNVVVPVNPDNSFSYALVLNSGVNTVTVTATDQAGNQTTNSRAIILDKTVPSLTVSVPSDNSKTAIALTTVSGTVDKSSTVTVKLGNDVKAADMSGTNFSTTVTLVPGSNTIEVTATDLAGNSSSQKRTVVYDDQKPDLAVTTPAQDIRTNQANIALSGTVSDPYTAVNIKIEMDGQTYTPAVANGQFQQALTFTTEKSYAIVVTATNEAGAGSSVQRNVIYDITVPTTTATPAGGIYCSAQSIQLLTDKPATIYYTTDGSTPTTASTQYSGAIDIGSTTTLEYFAMDAAGNVETLKSQSYVNNADGLPVTTVSPAASTYYNAQSVTLSATKGTIYYTTDGLTPTISSTVYSGPIAVNSPLTLQYFAKDQCGNTEAVTTATYVIDTTPPSTTASPAAGAYSSAQSVVLTTTKGATIYYTMDGTTPTTASPVYTAPIPVTSTATLKYFAKDSGGNTEAAKSSAYTIAAYSITASVGGGNGTITPAFNTVTLGGSVTVTITPATGCHLATLTDNLVDVTAAVSGGSYTITNINANHSLVGTFIDPAPPVLTVSTLADGSYTNNEVLNVTGTASDNDSLKELKINGVVVPVNLDNSFSYALLLNSGVNTVAIIATDLAGNQTNNSRTIILDKTAPTLTITAPSDNSKTATALTTVSGTVDKTSTVTVKLGNNAQAVTMDGNNFSADINLIPGSNTIEITATDPAGNSSSQKRTVVYDDQKPDLAITMPAQDIHINQASLTVRGTVSDPYTAVGVSIAMDGQTYTPTVTNGTFEQAIAFTTEKSYAIVVTATNEAGSFTSVQRNVIYDVTSPRLTIDPATNPANQTNVVVTGTREPGITVSVSADTAVVIGQVANPTDTTWSCVVSSLAIGMNSITATGRDAAGNTNSVTTQIPYHDATALPNYGCSDLSYAFISALTRCEKPPLCSAGAYNVAYDKCLLSASTSCPAGYVWNSTRSRCEEAPECAIGYTYNVATDKCEQSYAAALSGGVNYDQPFYCTIDPEGLNHLFTVNTPNSDSYISGYASTNPAAGKRLYKCFNNTFNVMGVSPYNCGDGWSPYYLSSVPVVPGQMWDNGYYIPSYPGIYGGTYTCPSGGTLSGTTCTIQVNPTCTGGTLNGTTDVCWAPLTNTCAAGTYDLVIGQCVIGPSCSGGTLDTVKDTCYQPAIIFCPNGYTISGSLCLFDQH